MTERSDIVEKIIPTPSVSMSSWHVGVAAEALAAAQFARCGYDVSVQYGANQPEYDLIVARGDLLMKISVKGSKDGGWALTPGYKKGASYHEAADAWALRHKARTILCFVQFEGVQLDAMPRLYLAAPHEVVQHLKGERAGQGDTILYERHAWGPNAAGAGTVDELPAGWRFSHDRVVELMNLWNGHSRGAS